MSCSAFVMATSVQGPKMGSLRSFIISASKARSIKSFGFVPRSAMI